MTSGNVESYHVPRLFTETVYDVIDTRQGVGRLATNGEVKLFKADRVTELDVVPSGHSYCTVASTAVDSAGAAT